MPASAPARRSRWPSRPRCARCTTCRSTSDGDATLLARGSRSGIGIASFDGGGVIVDAGKDGSGRPPPVVARLPFPDEWRVILILDRAQDGLHGEDEIEAFRALAALPRQRRRRNLPAGADGRHAGADRARPSPLSAPRSPRSRCSSASISRRRKAASSPRSASRPWPTAWPRLAPSASARVPGVRPASPSRRRKPRQPRWSPPREAITEEGMEVKDRAGQELRR